MFLPGYGRFTEIEMPFATIYDDSVPVYPQFWSAVCIWQENNENGDAEFRFKKVDGLTTEEPVGSDVCT